jgi:hypothetical protein
LARQDSVGAGETRPADTARPTVTSIAGQPGVTAGATVTAGAAARPSDTARAAVAGRAFLATSGVTARTASAALDDDVTGTDGTDRRGAARDWTASGGQCRAPGRVDNDAGSACASGPAVAARRADRGQRIGGSVVAVPSPPTGASRTDVTGPAIKSCECCRSACGTALAARTRSRPGGTAGATGATVGSRRSAVATCAPVACRPGVSARASVAAVTGNTCLSEEQQKACRTGPASLAAVAAGTADTARFAIAPDTTRGGGRGAVGAGRAHAALAARATGPAAAAQADDPGALTAVAADSAASALDSVDARRAVPTVATGTTGT